jgi:predicted dehydrogenase
MRFGLVGTGHWARTTHAPAIAAAAGNTLDAVWGRDPVAAATLASEFGATAFEDFGELLAAVDAVAFSVPPDVQASLAIRAAKAGKHLLLEKPVALSLSDADELVKAVEESGVASVVFFTHRFNPEIRAWLADEHARGGWSGGGWSGGVAVWLGDALQPGNPFNTPWRREKGALWDLGPHVVSMLWACLGPVTSVLATSGGTVGGEHDVTHMMLRHSSGVTSTATVTLSAPPAAAGTSLFVWGEAGRSVMPATLVDTVTSLGVAISELTALAADRQRPSHPCDAGFGREVVRVLAAAQAQRDQRSLFTERPVAVLTARLRRGFELAREASSR